MSVPIKVWRVNNYFPLVKGRVVRRCDRENEFSIVSMTLDEMAKGSDPTQDHFANIIWFPFFHETRVWLVDVRSALRKVCKVFAILTIRRISPQLLT